MFATKLSRYHFAGLLGLLLLTSLPTSAQTLDGEPTELHFTVINATTGEPGTVDRMTIEYVNVRRNGILDYEPSGSDFVTPAIPLKDGGKYIVAVWYQNVPYWWSLRGHQLKGKTTTLHVFDTTNKVSDVAIKGLNLVIRRQETLVRLEYMLQVDNTASPQQTVVDRVATFEIDFPADTSEIEATYRRGPDPSAIEATTRGSSRLSLAVPLTPGLNHIQVKAVVPWREGLEIPVGSNLAINSWSILASPDWLDIRAMDLENGESNTPGFKRLSGPALSAGRDLTLQLFSGEHNTEPVTNLFDDDSTTVADGSADAGSEAAATGSSRLPLVFGGFVIIIVAVIAIRRRQ